MEFETRTVLRPVRRGPEPSARRKLDQPSSPRDRLRSQGPGKSVQQEIRVLGMERLAKGGRLKRS
jgi:hypothetical protein